MADSTESFLKETTSSLNVTQIYKDLMEASTEKDSAYIKAKETLEALFDTSTLTDRERGSIIADTISKIATGITTSAMNTAYAVAKDDREAPYLLAKLREDTILVQEQQNKIATDIAKDEEDKKLKVMSGWKVQGELVRDYGVNAYNLAIATDIIPQAQYTNTGNKYEAERQAKANVYNTYASSYRGNGYVNVTTNIDGSLSGLTTADGEGLTTAQIGVAIRQKEGFDDNMRQHVANSSATMMSMLLSTEASGIDYIPYLDKWSQSIDYLNVNKNVTAGTITNDTVPTEISIAIGVILTGTVVNISAGSSVTLEITDGTNFSAEVIGIVQLDNTWSVDVTPADISMLVAGAHNLTVSVLDSTGTTRTDIDAVTVVA